MTQSDSLTPQKKPMSYREELRQNMNDLIEQLDLSSLQKQFMQSRWLDQLIWLEGKAESSRTRYFRLRLVTIIGGVILPALVTLQSSFNPSCPQNQNNVTQTITVTQWFAGVNWFKWLTFGVSQLVAVSAAVEEFYRFGDTYRQYRNTAETMKIEGWQFFQLTGPYENIVSHHEGYSLFAQRVEDLIKQDVEGYLTQSEKSQAKAAQQTVKIKVE